MPTSTTASTFWASICLLIAGGISACNRQNEGQTRPLGTHRAPNPTSPAKEHRATLSNIEHTDYVGPEKCGECHSQQYEMWREHSHSRMNAAATEDTVVGDFSGARVRYGDIETRFERRDGSFQMSMHRGTKPLRAYRVTKTVGSRFIQMYIGIQTQGPEPANHPVYQNEIKLPFGYWVKRKGWFPEHYFDSDFPPEYQKDGSFSNRLDDPSLRTEYNTNCIFCHNTYAYEKRLAQNDPRRAGFPLHDMILVGGRPTMAVSKIDGKQQLKEQELVTLGISCESCHFGCREHAENEANPSFLPVGTGLRFSKTMDRLDGGARYNPYVVNSICSQCHSARVSLYPNGAGTWNSAESIDQSLSACAQEIMCTDCHNPHQAGPAPNDQPDSPVHIGACIKCHDSYRDANFALAHSAHPASAGLTCLDCHMPRMVQGLDDVIRTHKIGNPLNPDMVAVGAPNACNLCHLDKSIAWSVQQLKRHWGKTIEPSKYWPRFYGKRFDVPVGEVWLKHEAPIVRLVAADAYARTPVAGIDASQMISILQDDWAVNRMFGLFAIERLLERSVSEDEYTTMAAPLVRSKQVDLLRETIGNLITGEDSRERDQ